MMTSTPRDTLQAGMMRSEPAQDGMVWIDGGDFRMGSDRFYPEESPVHRVRVDGFWIDASPVTIGEFTRFIDATGYVTVAEHTPEASLYPGADPSMLVAGSLVFRPPRRAEDMRFWGDWWHYVAGANWRNPNGAGDATDTLTHHPVVHVCLADAVAYADWAGKSLPTEAEWEYAARGGLDGADYGWGDELEPQGRRLANIWDGQFPMTNRDRNGAFGTSPICSYPSNPFGLYDMIGNVWEWTSDYWADRHRVDSQSCCIPANPRTTDPEPSYDRAQPGIRIARRVLKGGSHLCAPSYCRRYRPAARQPQMEDSATSHVGFRCVKRFTGREITGAKHG